MDMCVMFEKKKKEKEKTKSVKQKISYKKE